MHEQRYDCRKHELNCPFLESVMSTLFWTVEYLHSPEALLLFTLFLDCNKTCFIITFGFFQTLPRFLSLEVQKMLNPHFLFILQMWAAALTKSLFLQNEFLKAQIVFLNSRKLPVIWINWASDPWNTSRVRAYEVGSRAPRRWVAGVPYTSYTNMTHWPHNTIVSSLSPALIHLTLENRTFAFLF